MKLTHLGLVVALLVITACSSPPPAPVANIALATATATPAAPPVGIVLVATTPPAATPPPTATATPTPTPHPLTIQSMRERSYPGSDITIEETLQPGSNYSRYRVSYQSEGLKIYELLSIPNGEKPATGWPVIIFNHGFIPPDVYRTTERYVAYGIGWRATATSSCDRTIVRGRAAPGLTR